MYQTAKPQATNIITNIDSQQYILLFDIWKNKSARHTFQTAVVTFD